MTSSYPRSEKPLGLSIGLYFPTFPQKHCPVLITSPKLSFLMTIHLSIFSNLYKSLFNLLFFLHLWIQRAFPSAKLILCVSVFYATTASAFSYPQTMFSVSQFFMPRWPPLFLIYKAHFLCFSVFYVITASPFPCRAEPVFLFLSFLKGPSPPFFLVQMLL